MNFKGYPAFLGVLIASSCVAEKKVVEPNIWADTGFEIHASPEAIYKSIAGRENKAEANDHPTDFRIFDFERTDLELPGKGEDEATRNQQYWSLDTNLKGRLARMSFEERSSFLERMRATYGETAWSYAYDDPANVRPEHPVGSTWLKWSLIKKARQKAGVWKPRAAWH